MTCCELHHACYFKPVLFNGTECKWHGDVTGPTGPSLLQEDSLGGTLGNCFVLHGKTQKAASFVAFLVFVIRCVWICHVPPVSESSYFVPAVSAPPPSNVPPPLERELDLQTSNHRELPESLWWELGSALALISPDNFVVFLSSNLALDVYLPLSTWLFSPFVLVCFHFRSKTLAWKYQSGSPEAWQHALPVTASCITRIVVCAVGVPSGDWEGPCVGLASW